MNAKLKYGVACFLVFSILFSVAQMSVSKVEGATQSDVVVDRAYWLRLASNAWQYFQPGVGVNSQTGLHSASLGYHYFTAWDLGVYINAVVDAQQLGIISKTGTWGGDYRIDKVVSWLQTMQLTSDSIPYVWYDSNTGLPAFDLSNATTNIWDYGNLLIALHRVETVRPDLVGTVDGLVKTRMNTTLLASEVPAATDYVYYAAHGFEYFGYGNYSGVSGGVGYLSTLGSMPKVTVYGVDLPKTWTTCEPLLLGMFYFDSEPLLADWTHTVYLANEGRYVATGNWTAMSEGNTGLSDPSYVYEYTVTPDGSSWVISPSTTPIAYLKVAVGFLALNDTSYAKNMVSYLQPLLLPTVASSTLSNGYMDGVDENGRVVTTITDKTNGMILDAARYAVAQIVVSTPTPTSSPTLNPTATTNLTTSTTTSLAPTDSSNPSPSWFANPIVFVVLVVVISFILSLLVVILIRKSSTKASSKL